MAEEKNIWEELRKPFDKGVVGLLPKVSCYDCAQVTKTVRNAFDKHCAKHKVTKCAVCDAYITEGHIHLDYVGHAAVTDRLNNAAGVDNWNWEPLATDEHGMPLLDRDGNLWIRLTINGATRIGYGDGSNSMKELIGDALRNAAMRFGVALDLWTKDELESTLNAPELKNERATAAEKAPVQASPSPTDAPTGEQQERIIELGEALAYRPKVLEARMNLIKTSKEANDFILKLEGELKHQEAEADHA